MSRPRARWNICLRVGALLFAAAICGYVVQRKCLQPPVIASLQTHWPAVLLGWCLACAFVAFKSKALQASAAASGLSLGWLQAGRLFCEGTVVDLLTWPGKLWCDAYRVALLPGDSIRARVHALLRFRAGGIVSTGAFLSAALIVIAGRTATPARWPLIAPAAICLAAAGACALRRRLAQRGLIGSTLPVVGWSLPATLCDTIAFGLIAHLLTGASPVLLGSWYVVISAASTISTLPMNIGVFDVGCWIVLTRLLGAQSATVATAVAVHRAIGPLNTLVIGAASALVRGLSSRSAASAPGRLSPARPAGASNWVSLMRTPTV